MRCSYRRALERRSQVLQRHGRNPSPMDVHLHVTILRLHSEYLARLFTDVSTQLSILEQTLSEGHALTSADSSGRLAEVASIQRRLCTEGEMFCHRLHLFLEASQAVPDAPEQVRQHTAAAVMRARKSEGIVR